MSELNQYAISKILGSTMRPVKSPAFGGFGTLEAAAEAARAANARQGGRPVAKFTYDQDRLVVRAFEDVRNGAAPDAILWDRDLAQRFVRRFRELGLNAPDAVLNRRLINIRKNIRRYEEHGITISPTTRSNPHPSIVPQYAHVIEFALVRLRYRYGASIDDILLDPALGNQFEQLASQLAPELSAADLRLGALYIRKTRYLSKGDLSRDEALDLGELDRLWTPPVPLAKLRAGDAPASPGLIELKERARHLYISRNENVRAAASQFQGGRAFELVSNGFWRPDPDEITLEFIPGESVGGVGIGHWERRLIHDLEPVLNWPIIKKTAG